MDMTPAPIMINHSCKSADRILTATSLILPVPLKTKTYLQGLQFQLWAHFLMHFDQAVITVNEHSSLASVFYVHSKEQGEGPGFF